MLTPSSLNFEFYMTHFSYVLVKLYTTLFTKYDFESRLALFYIFLLSDIPLKAKCCAGPSPLHSDFLSAAVSSNAQSFLLMAGQ